MCAPVLTYNLQMLLLLLYAKNEGGNCVNVNPEPSSIQRRITRFARKIAATESFGTKFFPLINLQLIDPILLSGVLETLKIIPHSKCLEAFRFHSLKRSSIPSIPELVWKYCASAFKVAGDGIVLETLGGRSRTALVLSAAFWENRVHKWDRHYRGSSDQYYSSR
ncbi:hypothetical protein R1flu_013855 [Riccia fluitans]|uniref:Uncharacterized protein n=1 Tax=Riccia fluitans TaxID=41844 RepID=A0ABD1YHX3_9MARC